MNTDKILVFFPYEININSGGPSGFIAHNLIDKSREFFILPQDTSSLPQLSFAERCSFVLKKLFYKALNKKRIFIKENHIALHFKNCNAIKYKYIYFHDCETLYACRNFISDDQMIILQSHSPELPSEEYTALEKVNKQTYKYIREAEQFAFQRANVIILPNEDCIALYHNVLPSNADIRFILSGAKNSYNNDKIEENKIDQSKINLLYIGRRNNIKGFDIVLSAFKKAYQSNKNINLIVVGNGDKINAEGIIDVGFQKSPISWYNSVDYLINSNRKSYFDLSIIEAISTGVPIIMSENYGHKWFKDRSELITMFDGTEEGLSNLLASPLLQKRNFSNKSNVELYNQFLTDEHYFERFISFFRQLQEEHQ